MVFLIVQFHALIALTKIQLFDSTHICLQLVRHNAILGHPPKLQKTIDVLGINIAMSNSPFKIEMILSIDKFINEHLERSYCHKKNLFNQ